MEGHYFIIFIQHFLVGVIFILASLSLIIHHHTKEKSFLYYSLYSYLVLGYLVLKMIDQTDSELKTIFYRPRFIALNWYVQITYYSLYFFFYLHFLDFHKTLPKFYRNLKSCIIGIFALSSLFFIYSLILNDGKVFFLYFTYFFLPLILVAVVITIIKAFETPGNLKYFITIGSATYVLLALTSMYFTVNEGIFDSPLIFFWMGLLIEQFVFSLGLAYKVKLLNQKMIFHFKENEKIRKNQNEILSREIKIKEKEILEISARAEKERLAKLESELNSEIHRLQLELLKNQMNPHFIFNALTSIKVFLIDNDKKNAITYLNRFSKLIRKSLDGLRTEFHTLEEEMEILKLYLSIENIRFNSGIDIVFRNEPDVFLSTIKIPPLLLQPFVENAIWHGLMHSPKAYKQIIFDTCHKDGAVYLSIQDNGVGRNKSQEFNKNRTFQKKSIGLKLIQERIDVFNQQNHVNYHFKIADLYNADGSVSGTKVEFCFDSTQK